MAFTLNAEVTTNDNVFLSRTWGQMADRLGFISFEALNTKVIYRRTSEILQVPFQTTIKQVT